MPIEAMHGLTHVIDGPNRIAVADKPARGAAVAPSVGFVVVPTAGTGFRGVGFALTFEHDARSSEFVGEVVSLFAVRPAAHLLLGIRVQALPVADVPHLTDDQALRPLRPRVIRDGPCDLVLNSTPLALVAGAQEGLAAGEALPTTRALLFAGQRRLEARQLLVAVLVDRPQVAGSEDDHLALFVRHGGRVDLT